MAERVVRLILTGDSAGAVRAMRQVDAAANTTRGHLDRLHTAGQKIGSLGRTMTAMSIPLVGIGIASVKAASTFASSMTQIRTMTGASQRQVNEWGKQLQGLSGQLATSPDQLAQGLYHIASTTHNGAKAMHELTAAAKLAKIGHANLEDVTNALNATVVSGIPGTKNFTQAVALMAHTVGTGDMRVQDLADALGTGLLGPLRRYGVNVKDIGAALAVFGDNNIRGAEAGTKLASAIRIMAAPAPAAAKWLKEIGMAPLDMANNLRKGGLVPALQELQRHLAPFTQSQQADILTRIFGGKQSTGVQLLIGQLSRLQQKHGEMTGGLQQIWNAYTKNDPTYKFQKLQATYQNMMIKLGNAIMPLVLQILPRLTRVLTDVVGWFTHLPKSTQRLVMWFTAFLAIGGPILMFVGGLVRAMFSIKEAFGLLKGPLGGLLSKIPGLVGGFGGAARGAGLLRLSFLSALGPIGLVVGGLIALGIYLHKFNPFGNSVFTGGGVHTPFGGHDTTDRMNAWAATPAGRAWKNVKGTNAALLGSYLNKWQNTGKEPAQLMAPPGRHAMGGYIGGYGGGDRVHSLLEPGEYVLRKEAVRAIGVQSLNSMNASGGAAGLGGSGPHEMVVTAPIQLRIGNSRILAQEVVRFAARASAMSGHYVAG